MTAPIGFVAEQFGRKRLFVRGGAHLRLDPVRAGAKHRADGRLPPVASSARRWCHSGSWSCWSSYSPQERGSAMAIWGMRRCSAVLQQPWRLAHRQLQLALEFFIDLPIGAADHPADGLHAGDENTRAASTRFGFAALAIGIGQLQLMLDRREQLGWLGFLEIIAEAIVSGFYFFMAHSLTTATHRALRIVPRPQLHGRLLFMVVIGVVLFGTMALVTPLSAKRHRLPDLAAGILLQCAASAP